MTTKLSERVLSTRRDVLSDIERIVDDAIGELDRFDAWTISPPPLDAGGEWDWFWTLSSAERQRISSRWMSEHGAGPDVIADHFGLDVDVAMAKWLRLTRIVNGARWIEIGLRNSYPSRLWTRMPSLGGISIDDIFPDSEHDLASLFAPLPTCDDYLTAKDEIDREIDEWREEQWRSKSPSTCLNPAEIF